MSPDQSTDGPGHEGPGHDGPGEDEAGWAAPGPVAPAPAAPPSPPAAPPPSAPPTPAAPGSPAGPTGDWALAAATPAARPGATPGAPRRKRRGWIICLVVMLATILGFAIAGTVLFVDRTLPPYQGAYDFMSDVTDGNQQAATAGLCAADRSRPESAFGALSRKIDVGDTVSVNALDVDRDGDRAAVDIIVDPRGAGPSRSFGLPMRLERGDWKACPGDLLR